MDAINTSDGTLLWSKSFSDDSGTLTHTFFGDALGGFYRTSIIYPTNSAFQYFDTSGNTKWSLNTSTAIGYAAFSYGMQDESGEIYLNLYKNSSSEL